MRKVLIAGVGIFLLFVAYYAQSDEQGWPAPPETPVPLCGSFDIEPEMCATVGIDPPTGCICRIDSECRGMDTDQPQLHRMTFHEDDYGWQILVDRSAFCATVHRCTTISGSISGCTWDADCVTEIRSFTRVTVEYRYVEPFPQWCREIN